MTSDHASISPSGFKRTRKCPGWIRMAEGLKRADTEFSTEGSAAHKLAEICLTKGLDPYDFLETKVKGFDNIVDNTMAAAVALYVDTIMAEKGNRELFVEQRFRIDKDCFGTNDACLIEPFGKLTVYDFKYGAGVEVEAVENDQEILYAMGAIGEDNPYGVEEIEMVIIQPRIQSSEKIKRWTVPVEYIETYRKEVFEPTCLKVRLSGAEPDKYLAAGDHCQFCPVRAASGHDNKDVIPEGHMRVCPQILKDAEELAMTKFDAPVLELPAPATLRMEQIGKVLNFAQVLSGWAKEVAAHAESLLINGHPIPGYKLVEGRSIRKWKNEVEVIQALKDMYGEDIYEIPKLKSPTQMADVVGKKNKGILDPFIIKPKGKISMAPDSDKRQAVVASNADDDFAEVEAEDDFL